MPVKLETMNILVVEHVASKWQLHLFEATRQFRQTEQLQLTRNCDTDRSFQNRLDELQLSQQCSPSMATVACISNCIDLHLISVHNVSYIIVKSAM